MYLKSLRRRKWSAKPLNEVQLLLGTSGAVAESGLMRLPAKKLTGVTRSEGSNPSRTAMSWGTRLLPRCKGKILLTEKQI